MFRVAVYLGNASLNRAAKDDGVLGIEDAGGHNFQLHREDSLHSSRLLLLRLGLQEFSH